MRLVSRLFFACSLLVAGAPEPALAQKKDGAVARKRERKATQKKAPEPPTKVAVACGLDAPPIAQFYFARLASEIRSKRLSEPKAQELAKRYSLLLSMSVLESTGNPATIANHGKEKSERTEIHGIYHRADIPQADANLAKFFGENASYEADHQTNFGILQWSVDQNIYNDPYFASNATALNDFQQLLQQDPMPGTTRLKILQTCGMHHLYSDSPAEIIRVLQARASRCAPKLDTKITPKATLPVQDPDRLRCFATLVMFCPGLSVDFAIRRQDYEAKMKEAAANAKTPAESKRAKAQSRPYFGTANTEASCLTELNNVAAKTIASMAAGEPETNDFGYPHAGALRE